MARPLILVLLLVGGLCISQVVFFPVAEAPPPDETTTDGLMAEEPPTEPEVSSIQSCATAGPLIQFPLSVTSRNLKMPIKRFEDLPLFKHALASIIAWTDPDFARYWVAIAADTGDPWFDDAAKQAAMADWFARQWAARWPDHCPPWLTFNIYNNTRSRNAWAVNYVAQRGYEAGADYFYRINDDSELLGNNWSRVFVDVLETMQPIPGLGVVAPYDPVHKGEAFTHSMVGRLHFEVFGSLFPFVTKNQYSDTWAAQVYQGPYSSAFSLGQEVRMAVMVQSIIIRHKVLPFRYEPGSTRDQYEKQLAIDKEVLRVFGEAWLKAHHPQK
jgi:hypothetical protein